MLRIGIALFSGGLASTADAQDLDRVARDQVRIEAERVAAERAARTQQPDVSLESGAGSVSLGPFPEDQPCFPISHVVAEGDLPAELGWVRSHLGQFDGRCIGAAGIDYVLRSLQGAFLDRGLVTTRAGAPEQDLTSGTLRIRVVPGRLASIRMVEGRAATWAAASPMDIGDLVALRALEQGLEQMRRIPGREVSIELEPGSEPGDTILAVSASPVKPVSGSVSLNNFAGPTVGRWQGGAQFAAVDLFKRSEIISLSYNRRIDSPGIPADSQGTGMAASLPFGWWTFGISASANRYGQTIIGAVRDFETRGRMRQVSAYAERVVHRDQLSRTSLRATLTRRWARSYIDDVEIWLQRQDLSDLELALIDRHDLGRLRLDSMLSVRLGTDLFGAQDDQPGQPRELPTARYRIAIADIAATLPLGSGFLESWRMAFRGQISAQPLYGADQFSVGGPFTVRGYDSDVSEVSKTGWYLRQELIARASAVRPYLLLDVGRVENGGGALAGIGGGMRTAAYGFTIDAFVALPVTRGDLAKHRLGQLGISVGWGF